MVSKKNANQIYMKSCQEYKRIKNELKDDQMLSFIADTLLDKCRPVYKNASIILNESNSSQIMLVLPALQIPVMPEPYDKEIEQFINRKGKITEKTFKRNIIDSMDYTQTSLDGLPYNPKDFQFPISPIEKEKLALLAHELDAPKNVKKKKNGNLLPVLSQNKVENTGINNRKSIIPERKFSSRLQVVKKNDLTSQEKHASTSYLSKKSKSNG